MQKACYQDLSSLFFEPMQTLVHLSFLGSIADCCQSAHEVTLQSPSMTQHMVTQQSIGEQMSGKGMHKLKAR
jgi:hypothetical protein